MLSYCLQCDKPRMNTDFSPMLLTPFGEAVFHRAKNGWYVSEKYDGWRMMYRDGKFWTRAGNDIELPIEFYTELKMLGLPEGTILDGEAWCGYGRFQDVMAGIAGAEPLVFKIFDMPSVNGSFSERLKTLRSFFKNNTRYNRIELVEHERVAQTEIERVYTMLEKVLSAGGEGIVLRMPEEPYRFGERSATFLKLKKYETAEAIVVGHYITNSAANKKDTGYVSSLECVLADDDKKRLFRVPWKGLHPHDIGAVIVVRYSQYTATGLPKFPVYVGLRDAKDLDARLKEMAEKRALQKNIPKVSITDNDPKYTKTVDEREECDGFDLAPGGSVWVQSKRDIYKVTKAKAGNYYCTCFAWRFQRLSPFLRVCKHTLLIKGSR